MTSYVPNKFAAQGAQSQALRAFTPNKFAGSTPPSVTSMAPHLSVAAADRPYAADIALLQGAGYGDKMPDLNKMWNYSPMTYQSSVASLLRQPGAAGVLEGLRNPPVPEDALPPGYTRVETGDGYRILDEEGNYYHPDREGD